jgi:class 3 adenylate cyclase/ActR/RegA family two-component response regulator
VSGGRQGRCRAGDTTLEAGPARRDDRPVADGERAVAGVLFTDLVGSTRHLAEVGDAAWQGLIEQHDAIAASLVAEHGGRVASRTGDGMVATFPSPGAALRCGLAFAPALAPLGLPVRAAVHAGEVQRRGRTVTGIALHITARVLELAGAGDVLVTRTLRELCSGVPGLRYVLRGEHELRGVHGSWEIYAVAPEVGEPASPQPPGRPPPTPARRPALARPVRGAVARVLLVDDHPLWRDVLQLVLARSRSLTVVAQAGDIGEAVRLAREHRPDVVVMDVNLPSGSGVDATRAIVEVLPDVRVIMLSSSDMEDDVMAAVAAGARGYLLKTAEPAELVDAVRRVAAGEPVFPAALTPIVLSALRSPGGPSD